MSDRNSTYPLDKRRVIQFTEKIFSAEGHWQYLATSIIVGFAAFYGERDAH